MKKKLLPVLGFFSIVLFHCGNDQAPGKGDQNNNYLVTMEGFDSIKLNMNKSELEKILETKITLKHIGVDGGFSDTVEVKYKSEDITLFLDEVGAGSIAELRGIETSSPRFKTVTGIGTGSDKMNVISAYPDNTKYIAPEYEEYPVRSTTKSTVAVLDTVGSQALVFHIQNKKVTSVELRSYYEFY